MPFVELKQVREEYVTPKHSTAFGRLITGTQIELGVLRYKKGELPKAPRRRASRKRGSS